MYIGAVVPLCAVAWFLQTGYLRYRVRVGIRVGYRVRVSV